MDKIEKSLKETETIISYVSEKSKEVINSIREAKTYPKPFEFTLSIDTPRKFEMYIKGNKTAGTTYEKTLWKDCSVVKIESHKNYPNHPTKPGECWVSFSSMGGGWGDSNEKNLEYIENGYLLEAITKAIHSSIKDFTEQETI